MQKNCETEWGWAPLSDNYVRTEASSILHGVMTPFSEESMPIQSIMPNSIANNSCDLLTKKHANLNLPLKNCLKEQKLPLYQLVVVLQPEEQHRARYLSEGSRGAIKDRTGTSNCTIQLHGYYRPTRVELFTIQSGETGSSLKPHPFYRLIPVSGKSANATPCKKIVAKDGIECLEIILRPENSMLALLDCIGILKICTYNAKKSKRTLKDYSGTSTSSYYGSSSNQNSVRIAMRAYIPNDNLNEEHIIYAETDPIRCVQQLGVPEVMKMSMGGASAAGGSELFLIGRNFDRNTKVLFREYREDGTLNWTGEAHINKQYLHQCHIVCTVPEYSNKRRGGNVSVTVVCASKTSYPQNFVYSPCDEEDDWRPPGSPQITLDNSFSFSDNDSDNRHNFFDFKKNFCSSSFYNNEKLNHNYFFDNSTMSSYCNEESPGSIQNSENRLLTNDNVLNY